MGCCAVVLLSLCVFPESAVPFRVCVSFDVASQCLRRASTCTIDQAPLSPTRCALMQIPRVSMFHISHAPVPMGTNSQRNPCEPLLVLQPWGLSPISFNVFPPLRLGHHWSSGPFQAVIPVKASFENANLVRGEQQPAMRGLTRQFGLEVYRSLPSNSRIGQSIGEFCQKWSFTGSALSHQKQTSRPSTSSSLNRYIY